MCSVCVCAGDGEWWGAENWGSMKTSFVIPFPLPVNPIVLNKEEMPPTPGSFSGWTGHQKMAERKVVTSPDLGLGDLSIPARN